MRMALQIGIYALSITIWRLSVRVCRETCKEFVARDNSARVRDLGLKSQVCTCIRVHVYVMYVYA